MESVQIGTDAYNARFFHQFKDRKDNVINIEIYQKGYVGSIHPLLIRDNSLVIEERKNDTIIGTACRFVIINNEDLQYYIELFNNRYDNYVIVKKNYTEYLFEGFVITDIFKQTIKLNSDLEISATNHLSLLKNMKPTFLNSVQSPYVNLLEMMKSLIYQTGVYHPLAINNTFYSRLYTTTYNPNITMYDTLYINKLIFYDDDGVLLDSYKCLEMILHATYSRLCWIDRKWVIERLKDIKDEDTFKVYDHDTSSLTTIAKQVINISNVNLIKDSGKLTYETGCGRFEINCHTIYNENLVDDTLAKLDTLNSQLVFPNNGEWMFNRNDVVIFNRRYNDRNISRGIHYNASESDTTSGAVLLCTRVDIPWRLDSKLNIK